MNQKKLPKEHYKKDKKSHNQKREHDETKKVIEKVQNNNIIEKRKISPEISVIYPVDPTKF